MTSAPAFDQGDDLHGRTALLLLAVPREASRALFLLSGSEAIVRPPPPLTARFVRVAVAAAQRLPVPAIHVRLRGRGRRSRASAQPRLDDRITCKPRARSRARAAPRRAMRCGRQGKGRARPSRRSCAVQLSGPGKAWKQALTADAFTASESAAVVMDGRRIAEIVITAQDAPAEACTRHAEVRATVFARASGGDQSLLTRVLSEIGRAASGDQRGSIDRLLVRKIGKTTIMASCGDRRVLSRGPWHPTRGVSRAEF